MKKIKILLMAMFVITFAFAFSGCGKTEFKNTLTRISNETSYSFAYTGEAVGPSVNGTKTGDNVYYALLPNNTAKPRSIQEIKNKIDFLKIGKGSSTELGLSEVGTYTIYYAVLNKNDYAYGEFTLIITKATNQWSTTPSIDGWTFGQTANQPTGASAYGNVVFEYKLANAEANAYTTQVPTNAGAYKMRASVEESTNYTGLVAEVDFEISKATNQWSTTPSIAGWSFGQTTSQPIGISAYGNVVFEYKLANTEDDTYATTKPADSGYYTMRASVTEATNYSGLVAEIDFEISKASNQWSTTPSINNWGYGETANQSIGDSAYGNVVFEYKVAGDEDDTYTTTKPTFTGSYTMRASVAESKNYAGLVAEVDFEIGEAIDCDLCFYQYNTTTEKFEEILFGDSTDRITAPYDSEYYFEDEPELDDKVVYLLTNVSSASGITLAMLTQEKIIFDSVKITGTMCFAIKPQASVYDVKYLDFDGNELATVSVEIGGRTIQNNVVAQFQYTYMADDFFLGWTLNPNGSGPLFKDYNDVGAYGNHIGADVTLYPQKHRIVNVSVENYPSLSYIIESNDFTFPYPAVEGIYFVSYTLGENGKKVTSFEDIQDVIIGNEISIFMNYVELMPVEENDPIIGTYQYVEQNALANYLNLVDTSNYSEFCTWAHNYDANHYFGKLYYYLIDNQKQYVVQKHNFKIEKLNFQPSTSISSAYILYNARKATPCDDKITFIICELDGDVNTKIETMMFLDTPTNAETGFDLLQLVENFDVSGDYYVYELTDESILLEDEEDITNYTTYRTDKINYILFSSTQQNIWTLNLGDDYTINYDQYSYFKNANYTYYEPTTIPANKIFVGWFDIENEVLGDTPHDIINQYISSFGYESYYELASATFDLIPVFKDEVIDYSDKEFVYNNSDERTQFTYGVLGSADTINIGLKLYADGTHWMTVEIFGRIITFESNYFMINDNIIAINTESSKNPYYMYADYRYNTIFMNFLNSEMMLIQSNFEDEIVGKNLFSIEDLSNDDYSTISVYPNKFVSMITYLNDSTETKYGTIEDYNDDIYKISTDTSVYYLKHFNEADSTEYYILFSDSNCETIENVYFDINQQTSLSNLSNEYLDLSGNYVNSDNSEFISFMGGYTVYVVNLSAYAEGVYIYKSTGEGNFTLESLDVFGNSINFVERSFKFENGTLIETTNQEEISYTTTSIQNLKDMDMFGSGLYIGELIEAVSDKKYNEITLNENNEIEVGNKQLDFDKINLEDDEIGVSYNPNITSDTPEVFVGNLAIAFDIETLDILFFGTLTSTLDANSTVEISFYIEFNYTISAVQIVANIDGSIDNYIIASAEVYM